MINDSTFTFLFTDIEGSTQLWEQAPTTMPAALALQESMLDTAIQAAGGQIFKTVGDAMCAVFRDPVQAVTAALAAQRTLVQTSWATPTPVRVRMGLHCGVAEQRNQDYFGPTLNRVARITDAGHGGQILLSAQVYHQVHGQLPGDVQLEPKGLHHLKGLPIPEPLYLVRTADLPLIDLPLRTTTPQAPPPLLIMPHPPTSLVDRPECSAVAQLLRQPHVRLVTLTGPGGAGKTRLSVAVADHVRDAFVDGMVFVSLAAIHDPALVIPTIAQTLGLTDTTHESVLQRLVAFLGARQMLLILDNMEQVAAAAADLMTLRDGAPRVTFLVSSRWRLHVYGEHEFPVPPLGCPPTTPLPPLADLQHFPAIQLFVERARAVAPLFALTAATAPAVATLCRRLDGLPLAIELAAARVKVLSPQAILARLEQRFQVLAGGAQTLPARHQSLRTTIDWSYDLLTPEEQAFWCSLGVFAGGWTEQAAHLIVGPVWAGDMLDGLAALVDKSLVVQTVREDGTTRFLLLETLRAYTQERLDSAQRQTLQERHAYYFLTLSTTAAAALHGPDQVALLHEVADEQENVRAALTWAIQHDPAVAGALAIHLAPIWHRQSAWSESTRWLMQAFAHRAALTPALQARLLSELAHVRIHAEGLPSLSSQERSDPLALFTESLALFRALGDPMGTATVLMQRGWSRASMHQDYAGARGDLEAGLALFRQQRDAYGIGWALHNLGDVAREEGDPLQALASYDAALTYRQQAGDLSGIGWTLLNSGVLLRPRDPVAAHARVTAARDQFQQSGDAIGMIIALADLAGAAHRTGDQEQAAICHTQAFAVAHAVHDPAGSARLLQTLGDVATGYQQSTVALQAYQAALDRYTALQDQQNQAVTLAAMGAIWWWQLGDAHQARLVWDAALQRIHPDDLRERGMILAHRGSLCCLSNNMALFCQIKWRSALRIAIQRATYPGASAERSF